MANDPRSDAPASYVIEDVHELDRRIEAGVARAFAALCWVEGEVAERRGSGDWLSFLLVQPVGDEVAAVHAFLGRPHVDAVRERLGGDVRQVIAPGNTVRVAGRLRYSSQSREVELRVERVDATFREGLLAQRRRDVQAALQAEGLDSRQRTQVRLPLAPLRVGIVSGARSGQGYGDAAHVLASGGYAVRHEHYAARLEGRGAAASIAAAIRAAQGHGNQVVLLVRGGGSSVQLAPFDAEPVARAVAEADVPVVTGIGHQADDTLADEVSHQRCMTPTQAANFVVGRLHAARSQLDQQLAQARQLAAEAANRARERARLRWRAVAAVALLAAATLALGSPSVGRVVLTTAIAVLAAAAAIRFTATRPTGGDEAGSAAAAGLEAILDELGRLQERLRHTSHPPEIEELTRAVRDLGERGHRLLGLGQPP